MLVATHDDADICFLVSAVEEILRLTPEALSPLPALLSQDVLATQLVHHNGWLAPLLSPEALFHRLLGAEA